MSASHAETAHGHEAAELMHGEESAIETLFDGIGRIIKSVRIAASKTLKSIKGLFKDILASFATSDHGHDSHGHAAHGNDHDAHHASPVEHSPAAHH
jgi:hypothetical protein